MSEKISLDSSEVVYIYVFNCRIFLFAVETSCNALFECLRF